MRKNLLILVMLAMMMPPLALLAADTAKVDPLMGAVKFGQHEDTTPYVWKSGVIEDIDETGIRVADLGYRFIPETKFYSTSGQPLSWMNFYKGNRVKFVIRREPGTGYRITIVSMIKE